MILHHRKRIQLPYAIFTEFDSLILLKSVYILINRFNFEKKNEIDALFLIINNLYRVPTKYASICIEF